MTQLCTKSFSKFWKR